MAVKEVLEYAQLTAGNTAESLFNLNDEKRFFLEAGSFKVVPGVKLPVIAQNQRRWGGGRQVAETTENGSIQWTAGVSGNTEQECLVKVEELLAQLEANPFRRFVKWQPPGATTPTLYECRGAATWTPEYQWAQFEGAQLFLFAVSIPVAPLAQGLPVKVYEKAAQTLPEVISLSAIPGDAPALAQVTIETGTAAEEAFIAAGGNAPWGMAVDATFIYWSNWGSGFIGRAKLNGTVVEKEWLKTEGKPQGLAVDAGHIYWADEGGGAGHIGRATIAGGTIEKNWIASPNFPSDVAVDAGHVYWSNSGTGHIGRATIAGAEVTQAFIISPEALVTSVAVNAGHVYWSGSSGAIGRATIAGANIEQTFITGGNGTAGVRVSSEYVYWFNENLGTIGRAALSGAEVNQLWLTVANNSRGGIAIDAGHLYWSQFTNNHIGRAVIASPPAWALIGWASKPTAGLAPAPFGILPATAAKIGNGWELAARADAFGGKALIGGAASSNPALAQWEVDPATMVPDSFSGELAVEVWGRVMLSGGGGGLLAAHLVASAQPQDGAGFGAVRYTDEWGSGGLNAQLPEGIEKWRMVRLGTLHFVVNPLAPRVWLVTYEGLPTEESIEEWGLNYLLLVPITQRACSPSAKPAGPTFPSFIRSIATTVKTVYSNLTAVTGKPGKSGHPDTGLGGQLIELPPGETNMLLKLSSMVPDAPVGSPVSEQLSYEATMAVTVTPRWYLARTA